jgi:hypothetical protein
VILGASAASGYSPSYIEGAFELGALSAAELALD